MPRWFFLLGSLAAGSAGGLLGGCAGGQEAEAARATLGSHRASLDAIGAPPMARLPAPRPPTPHPVVAAMPERLDDAQAPRLASQFLGASPDALVAALGEPSLRRAEGVAAVWLYSTGGCQLDVVLYPGPQGGPQVAHVQARAGGLAQRTEASCLRDIASQAGQQGAQDPRRQVIPAPELGA